MHTAKKKNTIVDKAISKPNESKLVDSRIYKFLKKQLDIKRAQLKALESPLDPTKVKDEKYIQELILKNNIWQLEDELNAIEMMLGIDA